MSQSQPNRHYPSSIYPSSEVYLKAREKNGPRTFTTFFKEDNLLVPWKTIPLGEFIKIDTDLNTRGIPFSIIEDEVFKKYVTDDSLVRQINYLKAGIISTVSQNIWEYSAPVSPEQFNQDIYQARSFLQDPKFSAIHAFANVLMTVFAYKPEEVFAMDYHTFVTRLMQAEYKLANLGMLKEPFCVRSNQEESSQPINPKQSRFRDLNNESSTKTRIDAKQLWDLQQSAIKSPKPQTDNQKQQSGENVRKKWWNTSPVLEAKQKQKIDFSADGKETDYMALDNEDRYLPKEVQEHLIKEKIGPTKDKMVEDAKVIYKDLIEELNKRRKLGK